MIASPKYNWTDTPILVTILYTLLMSLLIIKNIITYQFGQGDWCQTLSYIPFDKPIDIILCAFDRSTPPSTSLVYPLDRNIDSNKMSRIINLGKYTDYSNNETSISFKHIYLYTLYISSDIVKSFTAFYIQFTPLFITKCSLMLVFCAGLLVMVLYILLFPDFYNF